MIRLYLLLVSTLMLIISTTSDLAAQMQAQKGDFSIGLRSSSVSKLGILAEYYYTPNLAFTINAGVFQTNNTLQFGEDTTSNFPAPAEIISYDPQRELNLQVGARYYFPRESRSKFFAEYY